MKKAIWLLPLALLFACGPSTTSLPPADTATEANTAVTTEETADTNDEAGQSSDVVPAATNFDNFSPAQSVEEAAVVREQDWRKGAADPGVVIIEYGDFQ